MHEAGICGAFRSYNAMPDGEGDNYSVQTAESRNQEIMGTYKDKWHTGMQFSWSYNYVLSHGQCVLDFVSFLLRPRTRSMGPRSMYTRVFQPIHTFKLCVYRARYNLCSRLCKRYEQKSKSANRICPRDAPTLGSFFRRTGLVRIGPKQNILKGFFSSEFNDLSACEPDGDFWYDLYISTRGFKWHIRSHRFA